MIALNDPRYWRSRAEEIRAKADGMDDAGARTIMFNIANEYDLLAERAEARIRRDAITKK